MKRLFIFLLFALSALSCLADEYDKYDGWSVTFYGVSHHMTKNENPYNEVNPGIGIRKHFGECFWGTANCFAEAGYINKNSLNGRAEMLSFGSKWTLFTYQGIRFHVGDTFTYLVYENPRKHTTKKGFTPIPFFGLSKNNWELNVLVLSKNPVKAVLGKDPKAAFLFSLNYRF